MLTDIKESIDSMVTNGLGFILTLEQGKLRKRHAVMSFRPVIPSNPVRIDIYASTHPKAYPYTGIKKAWEQGGVWTKERPVDTFPTIFIPCKRLTLDNIAEAMRRLTDEKLHYEIIPGVPTKIIFS